MYVYCIEVFFAIIFVNCCQFYIILQCCHVYVSRIYSDKMCAVICFHVFDEARKLMHMLCRVLCRDLMDQDVYVF